MCVCFYRAESEVIASRLRLKLNQLYVVLNDEYGKGKGIEPKEYLPSKVEDLEKMEIDRLDFFKQGRTLLLEQIGADFDLYDRDQREEDEMKR